MKIGNLLQEQWILPNSTLMDLAQNIAARDMEAIVLQYLGFEEPKIRNMSDACRDDKEKFNFDILYLWSQKSGSTKEVKE